MGPTLPPTPDDARFTSAVMPLLDLEVILSMDHGAARTWALGSERTVFGTTIVLREPIVATLPAHGIDVDLPLSSVAGLALLHAMHQCGADPEALADVVCELDEATGGPLLVHRTAQEVLPQALAEAAERHDDPSLQRALSRDVGGWRLHPEVQRIVEGCAYDGEGWIAEVVLADLDVIKVVATADGRDARTPAGDVHAHAVVELFRHGYTLGGVAAALDCTPAEVEEALRQRI